MMMMTTMMKLKIFGVDDSDDDGDNEDFNCLSLMIAMFMITTV